jgi:hypothetical protein
VIIALLLAAAQPVAVEPIDDRLFRLGEESHLLGSRLHDQFFGNSDYRERLKGEGFARACAAHFLAYLKVEPRYAGAFRPFVIESMRSVVPAERLAAARLPLNHDPQLVAWTGRVRDEINRRAAGVLTQAAVEYDRQFAAELVHVAGLALPAAEPVDRTGMNGPQLGISCFIYFGTNRAAILAAAKDGAKN